MLVFLTVNTLLFPPNSSVIDLTIATANMASLGEVRTEDTWGSDHYPITIKIGISLVLHQRYVYKINLSTKELIDFQDSSWFIRFVYQPSTI